jgi:hypothetical protein
MKLYNKLWLVGFKEVQNKTLNVEMKDFLLPHDKWENPWPSSFTNSLNLIDYYTIEANKIVMRFQMLVCM